MNEKNGRAFFVEKHRHEVLWQIWLPVCFGALAILSLGLLAAFSLQTGSDASVRWGHVAAIWLILPLFIIGFFTLILLVGLCVAVFKLTDILPGYAIIIQDLVKVISVRVRSMADKSLTPLIGLRTQKAALERLSITIRYMILGGFRD